MIKENTKRIMSELPADVTLVVAAKTRTPDEILQAVAAGVGVIGENYVQEAQDAFAAIGQRAHWHFIGRLQKNKVKKAALGEIPVPKSVNCVRKSITWKRKLKLRISNSEKKIPSWIKLTN